MTRERLIPWLPWLLAAAAILVFAVSPGGWILAAAWALVILVVRVVASLAPSREARTIIGVLFVAVCLLAAFEGGWYVIPAGLAFLWADRRPTVGPVAPPLGGPQLEIIAGVMSAVVGWLALAVIVWAPLYTSRRSEATAVCRSSPPRAR
jgi:hypothetical protein